ncbi:MAG: hypothetical protein ACYTKD_29230 [Planctomycetota bacterium]
MILLAWAILRLLILWTALFALFAGIGLAVRRALGRSAGGPEDLLISFWLGWGATVAFLQLWHLWTPVDLAAALVVALAGTQRRVDACSNGCLQV